MDTVSTNVELIPNIFSSKTESLDIQIKFAKQY